MRALRTTRSALAQGARSQHHEHTESGCGGVQNLVFMEKVRSLAAARGCTPGQLALALVHVQSEDVFSISGTRRIKYLKENVAAAHLKLTADEKKRLETNFDARHVSSIPS